MIRIGFVFAALACCLFCADAQAQKQCRKNANSNQSARSGNPRSGNSGSANQIFASMIADGEKRGGGNAQGQRGQKGPRQEGAQGQRGGAREGQQGFGQDQGNPAPRLMLMFKKMDRNGDGAISKREAPERLRENFDRADRNSDGVLDRKEQIAVMKRILESMKNGAGPDGARGPQQKRDGEANDRREEGKGGNKGLTRGE